MYDFSRLLIVDLLPAHYISWDFDVDEPRTDGDVQPTFIGGCTVALSPPPHTPYPRSPPPHGLPPHNPPQHIPHPYSQPPRSQNSPSPTPPCPSHLQRFEERLAGVEVQLHDMERERRYYGYTEESPVKHVELEKDC
ncbi:hypothetical protein F511_20541 [Dorcoceras hygrometricum]|uniref:Uncharacterized protein n=1 Tax=Dorcoceras hygrometricum TaxID=472368 RepID=A0A2Z7CME6_9LAMI|nr:hypothetical protein F511_20541 [Dorcoceras hygrometricum]